MPWTTPHGPRATQAITSTSFAASLKGCNDARASKGIEPASNNPNVRRVTSQAGVEPSQSLALVRPSFDVTLQETPLSHKPFESQGTLNERSCTGLRPKETAASAIVSREGTTPPLAVADSSPQPTRPAHTAVREVNLGRRCLRWTFGLMESAPPPSAKARSRATEHRRCVS